MFLLYAVQTGSLAHNAASAVRSSPGPKTTWRVNLTTYLHLIQRSGMPGALHPAPPPPKGLRGGKAETVIYAWGYLKL